MRTLELKKDYTSGGGLIVIDRLGDYGNRGFDGDDFEHDLFCSIPHIFREATKEEVIEAFKKHLVYRYGEDWKTMKIKGNHPSSNHVKSINDGLWNVVISKLTDGWSVWNKNGLLYRSGIWVERLEEPKIHIQEAIKKNTVIHCETIEEAKRILAMAHKLGYTWKNGGCYMDITRWNVEKSKTCYNLVDGLYGDYNFFKNNNYNIIPSTQVADLEPEKSTDWTPAPEDIEAIDKKAIEKLPIDKVTTKNLDIALRMVGIQLDINIIDKVIDLVELIENKGDDVTIKNVVSLQQTWSRHSEAFH